MTSFAEASELTALASPRDLLVNIVARALKAAGKSKHAAKPKDADFYRGRAFEATHSAAMLVAMLYGGDYENTRPLLAEEIRKAISDISVSGNWRELESGEEDWRNAQADMISTKLIDAI